MLKVLIVDDDMPMRSHLKNLMDWHSNGFEICGEANNGINAVESIKRKVPDIIITDMNMPMMDGIGLIEHIEHQYPHIKLIALSGYDDFDYVHQSMKKGAIDYILKHRLNKDTLLSALEAARKSIMQDRQKEQREQDIKKQISQAQSALIQDFVRRLLKGAFIDKDSIYNMISSLDIPLDMHNIAIVLAEIDDYILLSEKYSSKELDLLIQSYMDVCTEILKEYTKATITHMEKGQFAILFSFGNIRSDLYIYSQLTAAVTRMKASVKRYLNITASFSISKICNDIIDLHSYYRQAEQTLREKFFAGKDNILREEDLEYKKEAYFGLDIQEEKSIILQVRSLHYSGTKNILNNVFDKMIKCNVDYKSAQMVCAELINIVNKIAREAGIHTSSIYSNEDIPYNKLRKYETIDDIKYWILEIYCKLISLLHAMQIDENYADYTKEAIKYIYANYHNSISLKDVADYIGVSSSHLSRVFKQDTGKRFVEYLNSVRVEQAIALMEQGEKNLKAIVKKIGFNHYNYFFKVFKDITGMTPLEYEQNNQK